MCCNDFLGTLSFVGGVSGALGKNFLDGYLGPAHSLLRSWKIFKGKRK